MKKVLIVVFMVLASVIVMAACEQGKQPTVKVGDALPTVALPTLDGREVELPGLSKGNVTVMLFWSEGCKYCERGMPEIEALYQKYRSKGLAFVAVQVGGGRQATEDLQKRFNLTFPMLYDSKSAIIKAYGIAGVPTMFVVDRAGAVREKILGGLEGPALEELVLKRLN